jgi:hypothetical protein
MNMNEEADKLQLMRRKKKKEMVDLLSRQCIKYMKNKVFPIVNPMNPKGCKCRLKKNEYCSIHCGCKGGCNEKCGCFRDGSFQKCSATKNYQEKLNAICFKIKIELTKMPYERLVQEHDVISSNMLCILNQLASRYNSLGVVRKDLAMISKPKSFYLK